MTYIALLKHPLFLALLAVITISYLYLRLQATQADNEHLQTQVSSITDKYESLHKSVTDLQTQIANDIANQTAIRSRLEAVEARNRKSTTQLRDTLDTSPDGSERDLDAIARAKPGLLEKIINTSTAEMGKNLEEITSTTSNTTD